MLSAGTFFGALVSGYFADGIGRRPTIILGCLIYIAGVILQVAANSVGLLTGDRAFAGLGVGFVSAVVILYASEISPKKIRGTVIGGYQLAITIGLLLAARVNERTKNRNGTGAYRIPIVLQFAWALILATGLLLLPESSRFYVMKNQRVKAELALSKVWGHPLSSEFIQREYNELHANFVYETGNGVGARGWLECFKCGFSKGSNLNRTLIGMSVQMFQQLSKFPFPISSSQWKTLN